MKQFPKNTPEKFSGTPIVTCRTASPALKVPPNKRYLPPMNLTEEDLAYANTVMERYYAMNTHAFDDTEYCTICGQSRETVIDYMAPCFGGEGTNIVAISHLRAAVRHREIAGAIWYDEDPPPLARSTYDSFVAMARRHLGLDEPDGAA